MKKVIFSLFLLVIAMRALAQNNGYVALDKNDPIVFGGNYIVYRGDTILLDNKAFYIDGQLNTDEVSKWSYVFTSINEAAEHLTNGSEMDPMVLYIAPYVYWIDNPDDGRIREPKPGDRAPFGLEIKCEWLKFKGLTKQPKNVVLASNRGQTIGAVGNFTMFRFDGQGTSSENLTFGNYCNVDLVFPLKPELNRKKRAEAIVQAQLIFCNGDKIVAKNTHFISRLNLCPFVGGQRVFFDKCHFESTDDALNGTAVYKECTFDFYSSKPFYWTRGTGAVFLNCDIHAFTKGEQYFTKANGQLALIDTRIDGPNVNYLAWRDEPPLTTKNYQYGVYLNGDPIAIGKKDPTSTVEMTNKSLLNAYRFIADGKVIYNTYNLLKGNDDWDPENLKTVVNKVESETHKILSDIAIQLNIKPLFAELETGKDSVTIEASFMRFGNVEAPFEEIFWSISEEDQSVVLIEPNEEGRFCKITPKNFSDNKVQVILTVKSSAGLEASTILVIKPPKLSSPGFLKKPLISKAKDGHIGLEYTLDQTKYGDESDVSWYRSEDRQGKNAIKVAVSRSGQPFRKYELSSGDVGHFILVKVIPKHKRSDFGNEEMYISPIVISKVDVKTQPNEMVVDFKNISVENQEKVLPGFWTFAHFDESEMTADQKAKSAWMYAEGSDGSNNQFGLLQTGRSASMSYLPTASHLDGTHLSLIVSPFKTAGQGFSVAHLYMDVLVNFDAKTKTGYGLRLIRTTKYGDAVDCLFVKYDSNHITEISQAVTTSCFRTPCTIEIKWDGNKLNAKVNSMADYGKEKYPIGVLDKVDIFTTIEPFDHTGFGIQYNGGSSTMINEIKVEAEGLNRNRK